MDELAAIRVFISVAESGSFSEAGRRLGMSTSSVSRQVGALEEWVDIRLFKRTTRNLSLTEAGENYLASVAPALRELELARRNAHSYQHKVSGAIRVHVRASAGTEVIVPALSSFFALYPDIEIDLTLTDERIDLLKNGVDVAVWLGKLDDSNMVARELSGSKRVVCASPAYLQRSGVPKKPEDLIHHSCLVYLKHNYSKEWHFKKGDESYSIPVSGALRTPDSAVLMAAARQGLGLVLLQDWMVRKAVELGQLQAVLTDYEASPTGQHTSLYVVYPHRHRIPQKVRVFIDFLVRLFDSRSSVAR
ncbi:LysR family transcriptional regulator [Bordetella tumbae]|uniref:LysR family transcriptional regulator n=1 Tax=Bordetella tumbae TaxID=1649139 RepID=UPI0039F09A38